MSGSGDLVRELAALLSEIAARIDDKCATSDDASTLRKLAQQAAGINKRFTLKVHARRGRPSNGPNDIDRRFEMARDIQTYMTQHGCSNQAARKALNGLHNMGAETLRKAWQEMSPLLGMSESDRQLILQFKRLEKRGLVKVTRQKG